MRQEANNAASPTTGGAIDGKVSLLRTISWFIRVCGVLVLVAAMPRIMHEGWPHSLRTCGSLAGFFNATMLFVMSFLYTTTGRTKLIVATATIVLGVWVMLFSIAMLMLPHL